MKLKIFNLVTAVAFSTTIGLNTAHATTYQASEIANNFRDTTNATHVLTSNLWGTYVNLPFAFNFYDKTYNGAYVAPGGFMSFTQLAPACCSGVTLPTKVPGDYYPGDIGAGIAPAWSDYSSTITSKTTGNVGSREYILTWDGTEYLRPSQHVTFQGILHEGSNAIELQYGSMSDMSLLFHTVSAGIQDATRTQGISVFDASPDASLLSNRGFMITPVPEPSTYAMMLGGLGVVGFLARRKKAAASSAVMRT